MFDEKRRAVLALLGFDPETPTVTGGYDGEHGLAGLLFRLIELPDVQVLDILAIVMAETLEADSLLIELLGPLVGTDMAKVWQADDALLDLIRDREVLGHVLTDVAGAQVAAANEAETGKVKRRIIRDCLTGENGRAKVEGCGLTFAREAAAAQTDERTAASEMRRSEFERPICLRLLTGHWTG